jgi:ABC-type ATPase with predicted acetyltransferase domain
MRRIQTGQASSRAARVARWFGVEREAEAITRASSSLPPPPNSPPLDPRGGQLILLTGPSGSGKSTLLRHLRRQNPRARWCDLSRTPLPRRGTVVDAMTLAMTHGRADDDRETDAVIVAALDALSRVGLGEVWTYLRPPAQLSEGQRWRLRLALALTRTHPNAHGTCSMRYPRRAKPLAILAADEFAAPLDRVTAAVVARALRKAVHARPDDLCAIVATAHHDLIPALAPDVIVRCDFGTCDIQLANEKEAS